MRYTLTYQHPLLTPPPATPTAYTNGLLLFARRGKKLVSTLAADTNETLLFALAKKSLLLLTGFS